MTEILYFARVREAIGVDGERIDVPPGVVTISDLVDRLAQRSERHAAAFADRSNLRAAIDQRFAPLEAPLAGAREVALFPPVTGG